MSPVRLNFPGWELAGFHPHVSGFWHTPLHVQGRCSVSAPGEYGWMVGTVLKECGNSTDVRVSAVGAGRYEV